jgi:hypothetical protein
MEESGQWRGSARQSVALAELLGRVLLDLITVSGRQPVRRAAPGRDFPDRIVEHFWSVLDSGTGEGTRL